MAVEAHVPPGVRHTIRNESEQDLYLFAVKYDDELMTFGKESFHSEST